MKEKRMDGFQGRERDEDGVMKLEKKDMGLREERGKRMEF